MGQIADDKAQEDIYLQEILHSHCERKGVTHKCVGVLTIEEGKFSADCNLCGSMKEDTVETAPLIETAKNICSILGLNYNDLCPKKRRLILLEIQEARMAY